MRSSNQSVRLPHVVKEWAKKRADELGYPSANAYFVWLVVYDVIVSRPHHVTAPLANQSQPLQDAFLDGLEAQLDGTSEPERRQLFEEMVKRWVGDNPTKASTLDA